VHVLTDKYVPIDGVRVHQIGWKTNIPGISYGTRVLDVRRYVKELRPDVFHAHYVFGYGTMAALAGARPLVITAMGSDIGSESERSWLVRAGVRYAAVHADVLAVKDRQAWKRALDMSYRTRNIIVSPSCCDTKFFHPDARDFALRWNLGTAMCRSVLYTRPFNSYYQGLDLAAAIPRVIQEYPDVKFVFVDHGDLVDGWKESVKQHGWSDHVVFVPRIAHGDMPRYLASADIFVDTFYPKPDVGGHGHGTNLIEAMSCGCAQILPDRPEYFDSWCHAILYERGNSVDLGRKLVELLNDGPRRNQLGRLSRTAAANFDEQKVMGDMLKVYEKLAGGKGT
jgi:glycosyltransferase involved in cell wall biosynthesis